MRESVIEHKVALLAKKRGWFGFKIEKASVNGVPDRLFVKGGRVVFVEMKNERGKLRPEQERVIARLREEGVEAFVCRSLEEADAIFS